MRYERKKMMFSISFSQCGIIFFKVIHCNLKNIKINNDDYFYFKKRTAEIYNYFTVFTRKCYFLFNQQIVSK